MTQALQRVLLYYKLLIPMLNERVVCTSLIAPMSCY